MVELCMRERSRLWGISERTKNSQTSDGKLPGGLAFHGMAFQSAAYSIAPNLVEGTVVPLLCGRVA